MDGVNKTLYIPLYGKALVSRQGRILHDPMAEQIWEKEGFPMKRKSRSKYLAYYMAMRAAAFDRWTLEQTGKDKDAIVLHLGCGLDSRVCRVKCENIWYDIDFPQVIAERRNHFVETDSSRMLGTDLRDLGFLEALPGDRAIVIMEGISMYLSAAELEALFRGLSHRFREVKLLMDCYSVFAARASRFKNPINDVGVTQVFGLDDPNVPGLRFLKEHPLPHEDLAALLTGTEGRIFRGLYAGRSARKLYKLYEYEADVG